MFTFFQKSKYILGLNARNLNYIRPYNSKRAICIADNKLLTKYVLKKAGLPVPDTYAIISSIKELEEFNWLNLPVAFTLKPNRGSLGSGVLVVYGRRKKPPFYWIKAKNKRVSIENLKMHILNILEGAFSLNKLPDVAFFEERVKLLKLFKLYTRRGIPDIRIIVHNLVPVMAELRLPTPESEGRANLHLGAIGTGIDVGTGITTTAIYKDRLIEYMPGIKLSLRGIKIPFWKDILKLAVLAQKVSKIGFLGVDIAIDRDKGPMILELNARPGLSIQIANLAPLKDRLERVKGLKIPSIERGVKIGQNLFGGEVEEELEEISGRKVIGINEPIEIIDSHWDKHPTMAKIDTGAYRTALSYEIAEKLGLNKPIKYKKVRSALGVEERPIIELSFILDKVLISTEAFIAKRGEMKYDVIVGRKDLKRFLVDPSKNVFMSSKEVEELKKKYALQKS